MNVAPNDRTPAPARLARLRSRQPLRQCRRWRAGAANSGIRRYVFFFSDRGPSSQEIRTSTRRYFGPYCITPGGPEENVRPLFCRNEASGSTGSTGDLVQVGFRSQCQMIDPKLPPLKLCGEHDLGQFSEAVRVHRVLLGMGIRTGPYMFLAYPVPNCHFRTGGL